MNETLPTCRFGGPHSQTYWSTEEEEFLKTLVDDNSGCQCAAKMSQQFRRVFTRNMIAGKVRLLGLKLRGGRKTHTEFLYRGPKIKHSALAKRKLLAMLGPKLPPVYSPARIKLARRKAESTERIKLRREAKMFPDIEAQFSQMFGAVSLVDVSGCHYPTSQDEFGDHLFCNAPIAFEGEISSYVKNACPMCCRAHALIATQPRMS